MPDTEIVKDLKRSLNWLIFAVSVLSVFAVAVMVGAVFVWRDEHRTHSALCTLNHDLEVRVRNGRQFLREHPRGIAGITPAVILSGIKGQESTLRALHGLNCPPEI